MITHIEVQSKQQETLFIDFPINLYHTDEQYIHPLDKDIKAVFDPTKNKFYRHGNCIRWLFYKDNELVGRVAAFVNNKYKQDIPTGGIGFYECIDDLVVSKYIFDTAKDWLAAQGMEAMDGPINFGERDKWWGLLVEGFKAPLYGMYYHKPYYQDQFESYGFQAYFHQLCFGRKIHSSISDNFIRSYNLFKDNPDINAQRITKDRIEKYAKDFCQVYNKAWASHGQGKQLEERQAVKMFLSMKPVFNEHICWIVYHKENPIAMWINLPDLNQWFKYLNGKFDLWHKLKFMIMKLVKKNLNMVGIVFGVVPEWQGKGIDGYMIVAGTYHLREHTKFENYEMQWIGDFNPKMVNIARKLETEVTRKLTTYRYLFDQNAKFERHKIL